MADIRNTDAPTKPTTAAESSAGSALIKLALEAGPLVVFFVGNAKFGIFHATAAFMVAMVAALGVSWAMTRKLPIMPLVGAIFVVIFGGLTLILQDDLFIKLKPTIVNLLFATILFGGLVMRRPLLKPLLGAALTLDDRGWDILTRRWAIFFVVLAILNEVVWRGFSTEFWISFKLFGIMPLTLLFGIAQMPLIKRHMPAEA
ncbi:MAG: septation protein A [Alphaproteobacteria bacterium]|jgi:intracellular septation protein|nr:septation protein A [Alphaproteobacteria bacterium]